MSKDLHNPGDSVRDTLLEFLRAKATGKGAKSSFDLKPSNGGEYFFPVTDFLFHDFQGIIISKEAGKRIISIFEEVFKNGNRTRLKELFGNENCCAELTFLPQVFLWKISIKYDSDVERLRKLLFKRLIENNQNIITKELILEALNTKCTLPYIWETEGAYSLSRLFQFDKIKESIQRTNEIKKPYISNSSSGLTWSNFSIQTQLLCLGTYIELTRLMESYNTDLKSGSNFIADKCNEIILTLNGLKAYIEEYLNSKKDDSSDKLSSGLDCYEGLTKIITKMIEAGFE